MRQWKLAANLAVVGLLFLLASCAGTSGHERVADGPIIQDPEKLLAVTIQPEPKRLIPPKYPKMAAKAWIEGEVYVKVFVDEHGDVLRALVVKDSGKNVGFEEAALEAARKGKWMPAETADGEKVGVWVAYPISFKLNKRED